MDILAEIPMPISAEPDRKSPLWCIHAESLFAGHPIGRYLSPQAQGIKMST